MKNRIYFFVIILSVCLFQKSAFTQEWKEYRTHHFVIYYKKAPIDFIQRIEESAERDFDAISNNLGRDYDISWSFDDRAKVYVYDDQESYLDKATGVVWSHATTSPKKKTIRTFPADSGFFDTILPHELGHIIFRELIGFRAQVPLWMEEGIAMYQETAKRLGAHDLVRAAINDGTFKNLSELTDMRLEKNADPKVVSLFYAESASVINYLITEHGEFRFKNFCDKLKSESGFEKAFTSSYPQFRSIDELNKQWMEFLKDE